MPAQAPAQCGEPLGDLRLFVTVPGVAFRGCVCQQKRERLSVHFVTPYLSPDPVLVFLADPLFLVVGVVDPLARDICRIKCLCHVTPSPFFQ